MSFFKLLKSYEHNFEDDLKGLIKSKTIKWWSNQICITTIPGKEHDYTFGNGSLDLDYDNEYKDENGHLIVPKREVPLKEKDFTVVCDQFKNTLFELLEDNQLFIPTKTYPPMSVDTHTINTKRNPTASTERS